MENSYEKGRDGEDYVHQLAYATYLKYWCYPNPVDINGDGKEICDLLILFRDTAIIISVKNHNYDGDTARYQKKVIEKSTKQLNGASRKLFESNRDIYIKHPEREPELFNPKHYSPVFKITINAGEQFEHYSLGDQVAGKGFINIFNKDTFDAIVEELDTIKDLVEYLQAREKFLMENNCMEIPCREKDLLALFVTNARELPLKSDILFSRCTGAWQRYKESVAFNFKSTADRASYFIDHLVKTDVLPMPGGEILARELMNMSRFERRMLAKTLFNLVAKYENLGPDTYARCYVVFNEIGHLLIYYSPELNPAEVDEMLKATAEIYAYKKGDNEREIIIIAATKGIKQYKFALFKPFANLSEQAKQYLEEKIAVFGWFKNERAINYHETEFPE